MSLPLYDAGMFRCVLRINPRLLMAGEDPPQRYVHEYEGTIHLPDENYEAGQQIGEFRAVVLDVESAVNERESMFDVFDCNQDTVQFWEDLYDEDGSYKERVSDMLFGKFSDMWEPNLLVLQRLVIARPHRGQSLGLEALQALIEELRVGVGVIAMKPFPLQFEGEKQDRTERKKEEVARYELDEFATDYRACRTKLRRHYAKLGFKLVPKTDIMVMSVDETAKLRSRFE